MPKLLDLKSPPWHTILAGTALFAAGFVVRGCMVTSAKAGIIPSPRSTLLPSLSKEDQLNLPYPPDALPGARDVETPFGTFRAYEWGPEHGRKVLLVHGISTPCLALDRLAHGLVEKGCRVLLFDLPGRGYSDTPTDIQHDMRLFTAQIMLVLASSPLSWSAANGGFALVGYSLGGGISASFTSYFPDMVNSLALIAPSGLLRDHHTSKTSRVIYSQGVIPEPILLNLVRRRLQQPLYAPKPKQKPNPKDDKPGVSDAAEAEFSIEGNDSVILSKSHPDITIEAAVNHQVTHHQGFVPAFVSSIRHSPIRNQHERWRRIGATLTARSQSNNAKGKVLVILGRRDPIIVLDEIREDAAAVLGDDNVEFKVLPAGHEVPITNADEVADLIWEHWQRNT